MSVTLISPPHLGENTPLRLKLANTLSHTKDLFIPLDPDCVKMYVCGPTVYDRAHIGNARCYVVFDVLFRVLKFLYKEVIYVRNLTDVDDKIILRAQEKEWPIARLTTQTTQFFHEDMEALGNLPPTYEPKATDHIPHMISMIEGLLGKNHAYVEEGHVYFSVQSDPHYGALSHHESDLLLAGARVQVGHIKRHPEDFVLWKPASSQEIGWESPWGWGRPGWHIECSAMSTHLLGPTFDIHGGGQDLIFPHHENELAQSTCFHGVPFAAYWIHNGYLLVEGEKMSKSMGNFLTPYDLLKNHTGEAIRYALLSSHYRQPLNWTSSSLASAEKSLHRLYGALKEGLDVFPDDPCALALERVPKSILEALLDDLNTPKALASLHTLAKQVIHEPDGPTKRHLAEGLFAGGAFLGLFQTPLQEWFKRPVPQNLPLDQIESYIRDRNQARASKDFLKADEIRRTLLQKRIVLEDTPQGTLWRPLALSDPTPS